MTGGDCIQPRPNPGSQTFEDQEYYDHQVHHLNPAIYIESYHDEKEEDDYNLDLSQDSHREGSEVRCINSAIFIERYESDTYDDENQTYRKFETVRKPDPKKTNRAVSHTDMTCTAWIRADFEGTTPRGLSFDEWLITKQKQKPKIVEKMPARDETLDEKRKRLDEQRQDFRRWLAVKKEQDKIKKKETELMEIRAKREEELRKERVAEKEALLEEWKRRKAEELKNKKRKEEEKLKKIENEKRERRERSAKAFENWVERSKYNPRPVPLNMGAESLRGSVSAMFINPTPWQENIESRQSSA